MDLPGALAAGDRIDAPVVMVVAHPDNAILGLGSRMPLMRDLTVIHLTDGAPRDMRDARREGYERWQDYAAARRDELDRALAAAGAGHARTLCHGHPDQESVRHLGQIVARLADELRGAGAVVTHPYEHGHPDHDTAALGVALACRRMGPDAPRRFEFASYHLRGGDIVLGAFWSDPARPEVELRLTEDDLARKRAAMACFRTQKALGGRFPLTPERLREAPDYDFSVPAPPGAPVYERWGIDMTLAEWRRHADAALSRQAGAGCG
jgi:N-acetylglucosamine malate deacetylase 2